MYFIVIKLYLLCNQSIYLIYEMKYMTKDILKCKGTQWFYSSFLLLECFLVIQIEQNMGCISPNSIAD